MPDCERLLECLDQIEEALDRVDRRFSGIRSPDDFLASDDGLDRLDGIGMMLIWLGETLKKLERVGGSDLMLRQPGADWKGAKGMRDILSHDYGRIDSEAV